jgi:hypothetical protein
MFLPVSCCEFWREAKREATVLRATNCIRKFDKFPKKFHISNRPENKSFYNFSLGTTFFSRIFPIHLAASEWHNESNFELYFLPPHKHLYIYLQCVNKPLLAMSWHSNKQHIRFNSMFAASFSPDTVHWPKCLFHLAPICQYMYYTTYITGLLH